MCATFPEFRTSCEDSHTLRLASELVDLRAANANLNPRRVARGASCEALVPQPTQKGRRLASFLRCAKATKMIFFAVCIWDSKLTGERRISLKKCLYCRSSQISLAPSNDSMPYITRSPISPAREITESPPPRTFLMEMWCVSLAVAWRAP